MHLSLGEEAPQRKVVAAKTSLKIGAEWTSAACSTEPTAARSVAAICGQSALGSSAPTSAATAALPTRRTATAATAGPATLDVGVDQ